MSIVRVSTLEGFRWWQNSDLDWEWYLNREKEGANEKMLAGTAFHEFMETIPSGEFDSFQQDGHTFVFDCSVDVALPQISEIRTSKQYGNLTVTGKCDGLSGLTISDYKLIIGHAIDGEQYMESYQWRYYLDLFEANIFRYIVFEAREMEGESPDSSYYKITDVHTLLQYRYPGLRDDCERLAKEFSETMRERPELQSIVRAKESQIDA